MAVMAEVAAAVVAKVQEPLSLAGMGRTQAVREGGGASSRRKRWGKRDEGPHQWRDGRRATIVGITANGRRHCRAAADIASRVRVLSSLSPAD